MALDRGYSTTCNAEVIGPADDQIDGPQLANDIMKLQVVTRKALSRFALLADPLQDVPCVQQMCTYLQDYKTPDGKVLSRDLASQLNTAIQFLVECRPLSVSMGNAIKFLKLQVPAVAPPSIALAGWWHTERPAHLSVPKCSCSLPWSLDFL